MNKIQMNKGRRVFNNVLMCSGFFGWGKFPEMADESTIAFDVLQRVISEHFGVDRDEISRDVVRMSAKEAGIQICETGNEFVFSVPAPRNPETIRLFLDFLDKESGGR